MCVGAAPSRCIPVDGNDAVIGDIASIIFPDLATLFTVSFDGEEKQLDESVPLNTSREVPLFFSALPTPPPPPPTPTLGGM